MPAAPKPYIVAVGGTLRANSYTERALRLVLDACERQGAETLLLTGDDLDLPLYAPDATPASPRAERLVAELRRADGVVFGSPGYHGGVSGFVKNAIDYVELMRDDAAPYLDGRAVGCVAVGAGWQGAMTTLAALRNIVHALRGWPTPVGIAVTATEEGDPSGADNVKVLIEAMAAQLVTFARWKND